jgi:hypothetical protein
MTSVPNTALQSHAFIGAGLIVITIMHGCHVRIIEQNVNIWRRNERQ